MLGVPGSIPGRVVDQLVRALAGWARRLVPCLGSPVQSQAGSWLSWLERWLAGLGGWCHAWGPRFNPRPGHGSVG